MGSVLQRTYEGGDNHHDFDYYKHARRARNNMRANKLRPFVPSGIDYPLAVQFYVDLGFEIIFSDHGRKFNPMASVRSTL